MCKSLEYVNNLIDTISAVKQTFEYNYKNVNDLDKETQDLEHEIELSTFDACKGYKLAKEFKKVRQERRRLNDENATLKYLYDCLESPSFKNLLNELQKVRGNIKREEEKLNNRLYTPRIRNDLTIPTREKVSDLKVANMSR